MARQPCKQTTKELRQLIKDLLPLAEAGEFTTGGKTEADARRNAEALAKARKATQEARAK